MHEGCLTRQLLVTKSDSVGSVLAVVVVKADTHREGNHLSWETKKVT